MLTITRLPVPTRPAIMVVEVDKLRKVAMRIAGILVGVTCRDKWNDTKEDGKGDKTITRAYQRGIYRVVAYAVATMFAEALPRRGSVWDAHFVDGKREHVNEWRGITIERAAQHEFRLNAMNHVKMTREHRNQKCCRNGPREG